MQGREGFLGIMWYTDTGSEDSKEYSVTFAPNSSGGLLRQRKLLGKAALVSFLEHEVHLNVEIIKVTMATLETEKSAHVPGVILLESEIHRLGLGIESCP